MTPTAGTIKRETPQNSNPYPYIADIIAAFAPGIFFIYGFSLNNRGIEDVMSVNGPPKINPHVRMSKIIPYSLGYKCTSYKNMKRMAEASREEMKMVLLKRGLKYDPAIPPKNVLTAQRTAIILDYFFMPIIER